MVLTRGGSDTAKPAKREPGKTEEAGQPAQKRSKAKGMVAASKGDGKPKLVKLPSEKQMRRGKGYGPEAVMFGIRFTHPEKEMFPKAKLTKAELAQYYLDIGNFIMPYLYDRPLTIVRGIHGVKDERQFVQRHPPAGIHPTMKHKMLKQKDEREREYMFAEDPMALVAAVQMDTLEFHAWQAKISHPDHPDQLVFDLDPGEGVTFSQMVDVASALRRVLEEDFRLRTFIMLTGAIGLHVTCPLSPPEVDFDVTHDFAKGIAHYLELMKPSLITAKMGKPNRVGKVFVDYIRNSFGQTSIVPYSTRARPEASVAAPVSWAELPSFKQSNHFTTKTVLERVRARSFKDPWKDFGAIKQHVPQDWRDTLSKLLSSTPAASAST